MVFVMGGICTHTERSVLELVRQAPFLVTLHYAFQIGRASCRERV